MPLGSVMRQSISNFRLYRCSKKLQMLLKKKLSCFWNNFKFAFFAEIVYGVKGTLKCVALLVVHIFNFFRLANSRVNPIIYSFSRNSHVQRNV